MPFHTVALLVVAGAPLIAALLALIAGFEGAHAAGLPVFVWCLAGIFLLQWLMFIHAHARQTERYFDLTGGVTFIGATGFAAATAAAGDPRSLALAAMIVIWSARLASFLFLRVSRVGHDSRFATILPDFRVHLMTWTLQGIWVAVTASCALIAITSTEKAPPDLLLALGACVWLAGLAIEVIADRQKSAFRSKPANKKRFIATGLWAWCRHPNYFGEILLWTGVALAALPALQGWQHLALGSPLFVWLLLVKISGADMLERRNDRTWGQDPAYLAYKARTPKIWPLGPLAKSQKPQKRKK